jgi:pimeloyl-ACP methyl ester carboxylesterase
MRGIIALFSVPLSFSKASRSQQRLPSLSRPRLRLKLNFQPLPDFVNQPLKSDLPTLVLSGAYDPATPVEWLDDLLPGLSNAYSLINPVGGHGQLSLDVDDACIAGIFTSYLNDPTSEPDASCLKDETLPY